MKYFGLKLLFIVATMIACKQPVKLSANGGHKFLPVNNNDSSFPYYPLKNKMPRRDSFNIAFYGPEFLKAFDEPNISLQPATSPVFRFVVQCATDPAYVITITEEAIIIKEGLQAYYINSKNSLANAKENMLLDLFKKNFPLKMNDSTVNETKRKELDSLITLYPELLRMDYYDSLIHEAYSPLTNPFKYRSSKKAITKDEFIELQNLFITHGYWKMPFNIRCENPPAYGCIFSLEANNVSNYNMVKSGTCNDKPTAFDTICYAVINAAGLAERLHIK